MASFTWRGALALCFLAAAPSVRALQTSERSFERRPGIGPGVEWIARESGREWRVDERVVTVRFGPACRDIEELRALSTQPDGLAGITTLRKNRLGFHDLVLPPGSDPLAAVARLQSTGFVASAEVNLVGSYAGVPNDQQFALQWNLNNTGQTGGTPDADIDAPEAWDVTTGDPSIVIAVIDSGVEVTHQDLALNVWINADEIPSNGVDDDLNGFIDDVFGWDFEHMNPDVAGTTNHGTNVCGIATARTNNVTGIAGVAGGFHPANGCKSMVLAVGDNAPLTALVDDALLYAADNGASVVNMSLEVPRSAAIDAAIADAHSRGVFLVAASGNGGATGGVLYPARHPLVVAVAATDHFDNHFLLSSIGPEVWVAAPGASVRSTTTGNTYKANSGTSFSAPHVSAVAALMRSILPSITNDSLRAILRDTAEDVDAPGFDPKTGHGRINARAAVEHVASSDCNGNGIYDPEDILNGTSPDVNQNGVPDECELASYCTAKVTLVCGAPQISGAGLPSASASSGFVVRAARARGGRDGVLALSDGGPAALPFQGGWLCLPRASVVLSVPVSSGGTQARCDGIFALDVNAYAAGLLGGTPPAYLRVAGSEVHCQWIGRDSAASGAFLSDGLRFTVGP